MSEKKQIIFAGSIIGILSFLLVKFGNPANMGVCVACFLRDISGALGMHRAGVVQYIRPEIIGIILGSFISALFFKEFKSLGGSSPFTRFLLGFSVMIGALIFLGCPLRMMLRIAGGDLNAIIGLFGFTFGIIIGIFFLNKGFSLKRNYSQSKLDGFIMPILTIGLLILLLSKPAFIFFSEKGPAAIHAPIILALFAGLVTGIIAQRTRLCMVGGIRDIIMFKDNYLLLGFLSIILFTFIGNIFSANFNLGFINQPIAHSDGLWNFLGMLLVGWASVLLGGCPLRQLILSGEGNSDSSITIMGLLVGAAFAHNFSLAASPKGVPVNGKFAVIILLLVVGGISLLNSEFISKRIEKNKGSEEVA